MNQTQWENARKSRKKHIQWIALAVLCILALFLIIICNNKDQFEGNDSNSGNVDSSEYTSFFFNPEDSTGIEKKSDDNLVVISENQTVLSKDNLKKDFKKTEENKEHEVKTQPGKKTGSISDSVPPKKDSAKAQNKTSSEAGKKVDLKNEKKNEILSNNSSREYSIKLPEIHYNVIDRKDIIISMALELFYRDSVFKREILLRRDALNVIALNLLQHKELASINKEEMSRELEIKMNELFEHDALSRVIIREFNIEKVTKR
jgi:hypothetical protein